MHILTSFWNCVLDDFSITKTLWCQPAVESLGDEGGGRTRGGHPLRRVTPERNHIFLWLNLERTLDKRHRKVGVVTGQGDSQKGSRLCRERRL